jgi:hypothetical protein
MKAYSLLPSTRICTKSDGRRIINSAPVRGFKVLSSVGYADHRFERNMSQSNHKRSFRTVRTVSCDMKNKCHNDNKNINLHHFSSITNDREKNDVENDKYYYLIKQKYTPTRHQKYKPNPTDGSLQKTISNKPFNERVIQNYTDMVSFFMPKGSFISI